MELLESFAFLMLVPVLVFLGRVLGRGSELARWAAQTGTLCGLAYVAVTFAVGFPAGAAAMYGAQHGLDLEAALAVNNLRNFAYFLSLLLLGGSTLGLLGRGPDRPRPPPLVGRVRDRHLGRVVRLDPAGRR